MRCCHISCCARACWRREQLTSRTVQDWTEMVFCGRRTPNVKGPRRRRRRWNWRSFASSHGLRFNESTGNYGVPRVDRRGAALPRLGDSVCLFCFEPKSNYPRAPVQPESTLNLGITGIIQKLIGALPTPNTPPRGECLIRAAKNCNVRVDKSKSPTPITETYALRHQEISSQG